MNGETTWRCFQNSATTATPMLIFNKSEIEFTPTVLTTNHQDTDVVMQESFMPRVLDQIGSTSLADLILTPAKIQMDT